MAEWIIAFVVLLTSLGGIARWVYGRARDVEIAVKFIEDVSSNHLPHLYHGLTLVAKKLDVVIDDPPPIRFIPFREK